MYDKYFYNKINKVFSHMEEFLKSRIKYLENQLRIAYLTCTVLLAGIMIVGVAYLGTQIITNRQTFVQWQADLKAANSHLAIVCDYPQDTKQ